MIDRMIMDFLHLDILKYNILSILDTYLLIPRVPLPRPSALRCSLMIYNPRFLTTYAPPPHA